MRVRRCLNQFHILYTSGRQVNVAMKRNMRGDPFKHIAKAMIPLTYRRLIGK